MTNADDDKPHFTPGDILKSVFDPVLAREVDDYAKEAGWDKNEIPTLDLRTVPPEQWEAHVFEDFLTIPPDVRKYLDGVPAGQKLTQAEIDAIEDRIDAFYGLKPPYTVVLEPCSNSNRWTALFAKG